MTDLQMIGMIVLKLWWFIIPVVAGGLYGVRLDKKEDDRWTTQ